MDVKKPATPKVRRPDDLSPNNGQFAHPPGAMAIGGASGPNVKGGPKRSKEMGIRKPGRGM